MKTTSNKTVHVLLAVIAAAVALGAFVMFRHRHKVDYMEFFGIGYSDMISFVVQGYQCHWQNMSPESMDLSPVYAYESEFGAFIEYDIDGDGVGELLMGEQAEDGSYQIYDIFTFNRRNGETIQLFSGGERDWCTLGGNGIIIENGSNSAFESFTKYWKLKNRKLKVADAADVSGTAPEILMDKFVNYSRNANAHVSPGPEMKVVIMEDGHVGRYSGEDEKYYFVSIQDDFKVEKTEAKIELWRAAEGYGIIYLKDFGTRDVLMEKNENAYVVGKMLYEEGYCPETYPCLGYLDGWFKTKVDGKEGYIRESEVNWDAINTF